MRNHALTVIIESERDTPDVARLAADIARLAELEPDVEVSSIQVHTWADDDGDCDHHDVPVDAFTAHEEG